MGRPLGSKNKDPIPLVIRLYSKVNKVTDKNCWEMDPPKGARYPVLQIGRKAVRAHRLSFEIFYGKKIPKNKFGLHKCDNTKCINPEHIFIGTHSQNMQDMIKKGRNRYDPPCGSRCAQHKLIESQILLIRDELKNIKGRQPIADKYKELSIKYKVSTHTIYGINKRIIWKHI